MANKAPNRLNIIQHNVLCWTEERKYSLANMYLENNPDIILISSHCLLDDERIKIWLVTYFSNKNNPLIILTHLHSFTTDSYM